MRSRGGRNGLMMKFDRNAIEDLIEGMGLEYPAQVESDITGELWDGTQFEGSDTIKVIKGKKSRRR